jgi:hypothetical protein
MHAYKTLTILSVVFIIILALSLRFFGLFHDFWLDEIWSYVMVSQLTSPLQIFSLTYDNNHFINSFFIYLVGKSDPSYWFKYRILSFVLGVGTIGIAFLITRKMFKGTLERLIAPLLMAASFPLVAYSTEARGYSPVAFFSMVSFYLLREYFDAKRLPLLIAFNCSLMLGFLSHFSFIYIFCGLIVLSFISVAKESFTAKTKIAFILKLFLLPSIALLIIYIPFFLNITYGYGPEYSSITVMDQLTAYLLGYPENSYFRYIFMVIGMAVLIMESITVTKRDAGLGAFFITIILLPLTFFLITQPKYFNVRYFFVLYPFLIILLTHFSVRLADISLLCKICSVLLVILILTGNFQHILNFIESGRGNYLQAFSYIHKHTDSKQITISGDHTFRNLMVFSFYDKFFMDGKQIVYVISPDHLRFLESNAKWFLTYLIVNRIKLICIDAAALNRFGPEWFVVGGFGKNPGIVNYVDINNTAKYKLERYFPYSGELSGYHWFIYRRITK